MGWVFINGVMGYGRLFLGWFFLSALVFGAQPLEVEVSAESAILLNAKTGRILFEKNSDAIQYPASTTKVATCLYALNQVGTRLDEVITAEQDAVASITSASSKRQEEGKIPPHWLLVGGTHIGIKRGEELPLRALFYGMMLASGNDAANVIAHHVGGSVPNFMKGLNSYLKEMGCKNTQFLNPSGLFIPEHYTTARDMALIAQECMKIPFFREIVKTTSYLRPATNKQPAQMLSQSNRLLKQGPYYYPKAIGVKTGYLSKAGHTLVSAAQDGDRMLIAVLLKCPERGDPFKDSISLFEAAFNEPLQKRTLFKKGVQEYQMKIKGGKEFLKTYLAEDVVLQYFPSEEPQLKAILNWNETLLPPIAPNSEIGRIIVTDELGEVLKSAPLLAANRVDPTIFHRFGEGLGTFGLILKTRRGIITCGLGLIVAGLFWWLTKRRRVILSR